MGHSVRPESSAGPPLRVQLFGAFEASVAGAPLTDLRARQGERVLAYLVLQQGRSVSSTSLADLFWPENGSLDSLRHSVSHLRTVLGPHGDRLESGRGFVAFATEGADVDLHTFDAGVREATEDSLQRATAVYAGPLLGGWHEPWVTPHREARHEAYLGGLLRLSELATERGDALGAARWMERYVRAKPAEERGWCGLMKALVMADERISAIQLYERCRSRLQKLYQIEPPAEMTALYHLVREGRPLSKRPAVEGAIEPVGGAMEPGSAFYIERAADRLLWPAIDRRESIVLVKGPRQTGKSSLLARGLRRARHAGSVVIVTDIEQYTTAELDTMEAVCQRLAASLVMQLDLDITPQEAWRPMLGPGMNLERFLHQYVLAAQAAPVVWGIDEVDRLFGRPYTEEFFALFRSWHEKRSFELNRPWGRLTVALACATEAHLYIRDMNHSPFNVGARLTLADFTFADLQELNRRHHSPLRDPEEVQRLYDLVGGHPYLVRRALLEVAVHGVALDSLERLGASVDGPFADHLRRLSRPVAEDPDLKTAVQQALSGQPCSDECFFRLRSAGVLVGEGCEAPRLRCRLYADYLRNQV